MLSSITPADVRVLVLDVDGVLTDGRLTFDERGPAGKTFFVQDGAALVAWRRSGGRIVLLSGRESAAVTARAAELGVEAVMQGAGDKGAALADLCRKLGVKPRACAYVGDDWPDVPAMAACGYPIAVANAIPAVKRAAVFVTPRGGGAGGAADAVEHLLRRTGKWPPTS